MTFASVSALRVDQIVNIWVDDHGAKLPFRIVEIQKGVDEEGKLDPTPGARDDSIRVTGRHGDERGSIVAVHFFARRRERVIVSYSYL